jgi:hypothetical protein
MDRLDKVLLESLRKKDYSKATESSQICYYAEEWAKGSFVAISFLNGVLKVSVKSSPAAAELQIKEDDLKDFINAKSRRKIVRQVRIIISNTGLKDRQ